MPKKEPMKDSCHMCGRVGCACYKWSAPVKGIILVLLGILLWAGQMSLNAVIALLLILGGLKAFMLYR